jgi:Nif-specific regulatory protein
MAFLLAQEWPGNVRELENTLIRAMVMSRGPTLSVHDLHGDHWGPGIEAAGNGMGREEEASVLAAPEDENSLAEVERRHVQRVLLKTGGNKSAAARILEVSRPTLNRMIKDYELFLP